MTRKQELILGPVTSHVSPRLAGIPTSHEIHATLLFYIKNRFEFTWGTSQWLVRRTLNTPVVPHCPVLPRFPLMSLVKQEKLVLTGNI